MYICSEVRELHLINDLGWNKNEGCLTNKPLTATKMYF